MHVTVEREREVQVVLKRCGKYALDSVYILPELVGEEGGNIKRTQREAALQAAKDF